MQPLRKTVWRFIKKLKIELPFDPTIHLWVHIQKNKNKNTNSKRHMHSNVHSSIIYNCQDMEATCVHQQMNGLRRCGVYIQWNTCCSVTQPCLTLCDPVDCSTPGLPVPHHLPRFAQVRVHCIGDAVQTSHPLTLSSPSALNLFQHQGFSKESSVCIR